MLTRSHIRLIRAAIVFASAALAAALLAGCAAQPHAYQPPPTPVFVANPAAPPVLNLCADPNRPPDEIASRPGYVQMTAIVTDESGKPIAGLKQSDFVAWEGSNNLPIVFFRSDIAPAPVSAVVVVDESGSMEAKLTAKPDKLPKIRAKIDAVVKGLNRCDELAFVIAGGVKFTKEQVAQLMAGQTPRLTQVSASRKVTVVEPFTTDHVAPMENLYNYTPYGQTSIYDAIDEATRMLANAHYRRRAIILITDGMDNTSTVTARKAISGAQRLGVRTFVVGVGHLETGPRAPMIQIGPNVFGSPDYDRLESKSLIPLASSTGGALFTAGDVSKDDGASLASALRNVGNALGSGYTVGVIAPAMNESDRPLPNVGISANLKAIVRAYVEPPAVAPPTQIRQTARTSHS
jgi:Ca-activated chloride channel family protein